MKLKILILLLTIGMSCLLGEKVVAQTCATPLSLTVNDCDTVSVSDSIVWFTFNSGSAASWSNIYISVPAGGPPSTIVAAELYSGTCVTMTLIQTGFSDINAFIVKGNVSASTNYLLKVVRSTSSSGQLKVWTNVFASVGSCPPCPDSLCQLVCNHDLELYAGTPVGQAPANFVSTNVCGNWGTPGVGTPDYFKVGFPTTVDTTNFAGTEAPHSDSSYGGLYCYYSTNALYREYVQHQLTAPLIAGEFYTLIFWVSLADCSGFAVNDLGAFFSGTQPIQSPNPSVLNFTPQIVAGNTITDTTTWTMINGTFQAAGGEQWITIGSFGNAAQVQTTMPGPLPTPPFPNAVNTNPNLGAYYYIDDITLEIYPDPTFTWSGTCRTKFVDSTECIDTGYVHHWNFGDPASGANDSSALQNPPHIFTQNGVPFTVTHTITSPYGAVFTYTATVVQPGGPVANIDGYQTNNCGNGFITYTANPCVSGIVYDWSASIPNDSLSDTTGCSTNVHWITAGGYIYLSAWDSINDCYGFDTLYIPGCCNLLTAYNISNTTASAVLADPAFTTCVLPGNIISGTCAPNDIMISGVFTIDVPITFLNCDYISLSANTVILVDPGQTLTLDNCTLSVKCDTMWDGIHLTNVTSTVNIINTSVIQQARNAVVSNSGGRYFIENSVMRNNYKDIVVNAYGGTHPGIVRSTDFTMTAPGFWAAVPALPANHVRTVCAIEIVDNADITIGDPALAVYQNRFTNIFVGVRTKNSRTEVLNCRFANFNPSAPQILSVPNAGTAIVGIGQKNAYLYQPTLTVGAAGITNRCAFINTRIAVDAMDDLHLTVENNNISDTRQFGVRVQRCGNKLISVIDNRITNNAVSYSFNTGILVLECYNATVNLSRNFILQTGNTATNYSQQTGTGIRVACVSPADITLTIQSNNAISRVRTGIWLQNLVGKDKVFVGGNVINFTKPNTAYGSAHYGIRLMDCATVRCDTNTVTKALATGLPTSTMVQRLRGISIENSPVTYATDNIFTRLGSGIFGWETSSSSTLACNTMNRCYNGVLFTGGAATNGNCDIGDQINDPNNIASATGNTWNNNVSVSDEINGDVLPAIVWRYQSTPPTFLNASGITMQQESYNACNLFFFSPQQFERDQQVGAALRSASDTNSTTENRHMLHRYAHRKLTQTPAWLSLGYPDDTLYQNFFNSYNPTNVGTLRQIETAADTGGFQFVASACSALSCSNLPEHNVKVVYIIYANTWMQGIAEFTSADSAALLSIALQDPVEGGTAVYSAQVMLDLEIDYYGASSQRIGQENSSATTQSELNVYPNPANESVKLEYGVDAGQRVQVEIFDLNGKLVLSQQLPPQQDVYTIETVILHEGVYMLRVVVDGEATESQRLVIVK